ncbi:MAG: transposase [Myxococcales bacterium]|nr:MAG: transposase [Myxococcales bacterium]
MARIPRAQQIIAGVPHHVILRGNNRRRLFSYENECRLFVEFLRKAIEKTRIKIHSLGLLPNHVHLLGTPLDAPSLSNCIKDVSQRYARHRNIRRQSHGKLFEERFFSVPIQSDEHLAIVTAYIDLNAVKDGYPEDGLWHRWSTFGIHTGRNSLFRVDPEIWTPSDWYTSLGTTQANRQSAYESFAREYLEHKKGIGYLQKLEARWKLENGRVGRRFERPDRSSAL